MIESGVLRLSGVGGGKGSYELGGGMIVFGLHPRHVVERFDI